MVPGQGFAGTGGSGRVRSGDGRFGEVAPAGGYSTEPIRSRRGVVRPSDAWAGRGLAGGGQRSDLGGCTGEDRLAVTDEQRLEASYSMHGI